MAVSGSDAIEIALKTAVLKTGRPGFIAFEGGYHGLSYGALAGCGYKASFRTPFREQLNPHARICAWGEVPAFDDSIGAVLVEPIQGRGGVRLPPEGYLAELGERAAGAGALVIVDEIFTGLGRCGGWFAHESELAADLICLGKALGGGVPISACIGSDFVMKAWASTGVEAIHTSTFSGNPLSRGRGSSNPGHCGRPATGPTCQRTRRGLPATAERQRVRGSRTRIDDRGRLR